LNEKKSSSEEPEKKLMVYVQVLDATEKDMKKVIDIFKDWKESSGHKNIEFLFTDQQISLHSVDYLLDMLKKLKHENREAMKR